MRGFVWGGDFLVGIIFHGKICGKKYTGDCPDPRATLQTPQLP